MAWFAYHQNNSHGITVRNNKVADEVFIEAGCYLGANHRAEEVGLYFDGHGDCSCCGNRWSKQHDRSEVYLTLDEAIKDEFTNWQKAYVAYHADGHVTLFTKSGAQ